jgi:transposase
VRIATDRTQAPTAIRTNLGAIFLSMDLSRTTWLLTSLSPGDGERMSKHAVRSGDVAGLLARFSQLKDKVRLRTGQVVPIVVVQEAGLDGFWIHRLLQDEGIESYVVDPASIAMSRRRRRAKTDKIDGESLVRALLAYKRGEPRVCAMVKAPTPQEEDRRRICRERKTLTAERVRHVNRIKGLLFAQGISDYEPLRRKRRERLEELRTGDGRPLPQHLKAQIGRELDRLELILQQIRSVETERDALLSPSKDGAPAPGAMLKSLKGVGPEFAGVLWSEGLYRSFSNRRQVAAYAGLAPTPWQSGSVAHEQGVSKAGNPRLRTTMIQVAWLWVRHQPGSIPAQWFHQRAQFNGGRIRKVLIVALARKLLIAFWKYVTAGIVPEGAEIVAAWARAPPNLPEPDQLRRIQASGPRFGLAPKAEKENGSALLSPLPTQAGYWCSRQERAATGCEFEAASATSRVMQRGSDLGYEATTGESYYENLI